MAFPPTPCLRSASYASNGRHALHEKQRTGKSMRARGTNAGERRNLTHAAAAPPRRRQFRRMAGKAPWMATEDGDGAECAECAVCMNETMVRTEPCGHVVCMSCTARWMDTSPTCPVCRGRVQGCSGLSSTAREARAARTVSCSLGGGRHAGVTMSHAVLPGMVVVTRLNRRDALYEHGLRVGNVVDAVNGVTVRTAHSAIHLIEACRSAGATVSLSVHRRRRRPAWWEQRPWAGFSFFI